MATTKLIEDVCHESGKGKNVEKRDLRSTEMLRVLGVFMLSHPSVDHSPLVEDALHGFLEFIPREPVASLSKRHDLCKGVGIENVFG